jgi:class 3 adenylate cyclase
VIDRRHVPLGLGLSATALVATIATLGGLDPLERESIDLRFARAPRAPRPMTDAIVHVDIDDGALDSVGRWPWDRTILADAVAELGRAGAATVALDLVLSDPQAPEHRPDAQQPIDHDARLAAALAAVPCVVAVEVREPRLDAAWSTPAGRGELERLLTRLGEGVNAEAGQVAEAVGLTGPRRRLFLDRPLALKELAAWRTLRDLERRHGAALTRGRFLAVVAPDVDRHTGRFAEQAMLDRLWSQRSAWRSLQGLLPGAGAGSVDDAAPLPALAAAAAGCGFVNVERQIDPDGEVRSMPVVLPAADGAVAQLGVAAAALHAGVAIELEEDAVRVGPHRLPLRNGRLWIDWPTSSTTPAWEGVLRRRDDDPPRAGHVSIAAVVSLTEQRRRLEQLQARLDAAGGELAAFVLQDPALAGRAPAGDLLEAMRDEVAFRIEDHDALLAAGGPEPSPEELRMLYRCREWQALERAVDDGRAAIAAAEATLREAVGGRLVLVGWTAGGSVADFVATPLGPLTPGVVVHAALADMVLTGRAVRFGPAWLELATSLAAGLLATLAATRLPTSGSVLSAAALLAAHVAAVLGAFASGLLLPAVAPALAGGSAWIGCTVLQAAVAQRERRRVTRQFRARVSTQLVDYLRTNPDAVSMGGEQREITVLFADLAGFTTISERLGGPVTVRTLNRYLGELTRTLIDDGAYVNKFLGDGLMAFWSAFTPDPEQGRRGCRTALRCQEAVARLNGSERVPGAPPVRLRLGLATGPAIVGDCGAPPLLNDYTAIGDAVNLAARLESANKQFGTNVLIDGRTREMLGDGAVLTRPLGRIVVVGQSVPVEVFEVLGPDADPELVAGTARVVEAFAAGDRAAAGLALDELERACGTSRFVEIYRRAVLENGEAGGVLRLTAK